MEYKWYWHKNEPIWIHVRRGVIGDYWLIPELNLTVRGDELFNTKESLLACKIDEANHPPREKIAEADTGRVTCVPYLRVIDGKKK